MTRSLSTSTCDVKTSRTVSSSFIRHVPGVVMFSTLVILLFLLGVPGSTQAFQCEYCNRSSCEAPLNCSGGLVVDPCGCCKDCAKGLEEACGGKFGLMGRCDQGLYCAINPEHGAKITGEEEGVCRGIPSLPDTQCEDVTCDKLLEPDCPQDSISGGGSIPAGECCAQPYHCECMPCPGVGGAGGGELECGQHQIKILKKIGIFQPGDCCDVYECENRDDVCRDVVCEDDPFANVSCPTDSDELAPFDSQQGCCQQSSGCVCKPVETCGLPDCPTGTRPQLVAPRSGLPGRCCDHIECVNDNSLECLTSDGTWRSDGDTWSDNPCTLCHCEGGLTRCDKTNCPLLEHCGWISIPEGECCHQCMGCTKGNMTYANGAEWQQDSCVTCYCELGQVYCRAELCFTDCADAAVRYVPGICCPICDDDSVVELPMDCPSLDNCSLAPFCLLGLEVDEKGCYQCSCKDNAVVGIIPELCALDCPYGYTLDENGFEMCECAGVEAPTSASTVQTSVTLEEASPTPPHVPVRPTTTHSVTEYVGQRCPTSMGTCHKECAFGFRVSKDGCPRCKCNRCPPFLCRKKCLHGYAYNDNGCVLCKCRDNTTQQEPARVIPTVGGPSREGTCLTDDGRLWEDGQSWHSHCRHCFCHEGKEMCTLITCPVPRCRHPVLLPGDCCALCPGEESVTAPGSVTSCQANGGQHIAEGETWFMDKCTLCICHNGEMLCEAERCPPLTCYRPVHLPDTCCPVCMDGDGPAPFLPSKTPGSRCQSSPGMVFNSGDIWRVSACQSCLCHDGQIHCFSQTCPLLTQCNKTIMRKGQCCPQCVEESASNVCALGLEVYVSGETWLLNNCTWCVCHQGRVLCLETQCNPKAGCPKSEIFTESCCPACSNQSEYGIEDTGHEETPPKHDAGGVEVSKYITLMVVVIALVVLVLVLVLALALVCWRKKRQKERQRQQRSKAMQALFQREPSGHVKLSGRPKSVNLEYRGHYPLVGDLGRVEDYRTPIHLKYQCCDETVGLLTPKSKMSEGDEDDSIHKSCLICPPESPAHSDKQDLLENKKNMDKNDLNLLHRQSVEENFNINCGSDNTLTKSCNNGSANDLTGEFDRLSEFDNAACVISSSCSDFAVDRAGKSEGQDSDTADGPLESPESSPDTVQMAPMTDLLTEPEHPDLLLDNTPSGPEPGQHKVQAPDTLRNIPVRPNLDKQLRYSINDNVWLRNSAQPEKASMADKNIRYSVGAEPCSPSDFDGQQQPQLLGVPSICDTNSYRKSL